MDFIEPDDHKGVKYYKLLKNSIIFSKLLEASCNEQTVELVNFPMHEQILIKEFTRFYPLTKSLFETLKKIKSDYFWTFSDHINCIITFKINTGNTDYFYINIKKFWHKSVFKEAYPT